MSVERDRGAADLSPYLDDPVVTKAVEDWARHQAVRVEVPAEPWRRRGGSGALLMRLRIVPAAGSQEASDVLMKVCSSGSPAREPVSHKEVWTRFPDFANQHLFQQIFPAKVITDGRVLMFLDSSKTLSTSWTLGELPTTLQPDGAAAATHLILHEWNAPATWRRESASADTFLRTELRGALDYGRSAYRWAEHAGLMTEGADWIDTAATGKITGNRRAPNPMRLLRAGSPFDKIDVAYLSGSTHGDLHMDNIIIPQAADGTPDYKHVRLIDLSGFDPSAPLSRDVATLLLSSILPTVRAGISDPDTRTLVHLLTSNENLDDETHQPIAAHVVRAVRATAVAGLDADLRHIFYVQYLLSLLAQTIIYTSYSNASTAGRQWYFNLGAETARAFMDTAQA